jgi:hypothetical protein
MKSLFSFVGQLLHRLTPPCVICAAESFPRQFAQLEQSLRAAYSAEKGFSVRVLRGKESWQIRASKGLCSGFEVRCAPMPEPGSFAPTRVSVRVTFGSPVFLLSSYLLVVLYLGLIALGWIAPLVGWSQFPGPGLVAFGGAVAVIVCAMLGGVAVGLYARATGQYPRMLAQLDAVRDLVRSALGTDEQALCQEKVRAQRFRSILGGFLGCFGLLWLALGCVWLWDLWERTGVLVLGAFVLCVVYVAACAFFLAYKCFRKPATPTPPNQVLQM